MEESREESACSNRCEVKKLGENSSSSNGDREDTTDID